ncbi:aminopeptidase [Polaromonas sp. CG_9.11]|uniref:aminopeptidase n=1 Tax=Polaromonas sp. CG_9.11 TaxID=2787730 RepID=UPI0018C8F4EF|nr:aminopeptidase [Polaromonas sp. CG_9.11]MBG6074675.1 putative aminopeptidase [Polaromonas sp. CG_9.11]
MAWTRRKKLLAAALAAASLAGCADLGYYWQSVNGHLTMLNAARPVNDWLGDAQTPALLKNRLALAQRIRRFAVTELGLPDNPSYQRYADLHRSAVVWNVVAAPELSLTLKTWCFPVAGCVGYRGYFSEAEARAEAERLAAEGLETSVYGVPAYSTLGWMNWAGGDPLLSTFIGYPDGELARLVFHELAHQVAYAPGDTGFNESFATAVERLGVQRWLDAPAGGGSDEARQAYQRFDGRRRQFRALAAATRRELNAIYKPKKGFAQDLRAQLALKTIAMQHFREDYAQLRATWDGYAGYDLWVARANNASFGAQAAYDESVPAFEALFEREGRDWQRFYGAVRRLAALPRAERDARLKGDFLPAWTEMAEPGDLLFRP